MSQSCIETPEAPAWLSKLESQREKLSKGKLGHDSGAGAPCNACGPSCPGLDLHFWRKVCRGCHCPKDVHDVQDDDMSGWAQFELLGTARPKKSHNTVMEIRGIADEPVKLDWVPPNTSPDIVSDYMTCLGDALAPVAGSGGATRRREQLRRQIPPHDIRSDLCCHTQSQQEQDSHQEYILNIKNRVVGMGNIVRIGTLQKGDVLSIGHEGSQPVMGGTKSYSLPLKLSSLGKGINYNQVPHNASDKVLVLDNMGNVVNKSAHISDYNTSPILSRIVKDKLNFMRIESDRIKSAVEHGPIYDRLFKDLKQVNVPVECDVYLAPIKTFRDEYHLNPKFKDETTAFAEAQGAKVMPVSSNALNNNDNIPNQQLIPSDYPQSGTIFGPNGEIWSWSSAVEDVNNPTGVINIKDMHPNYISTTNNVPHAGKQVSGKIPKHPMEGSFQDSDLPPIPNYNTYPGDLSVDKVGPTVDRNPSLNTNTQDYKNPQNESILQQNTNSGLQNKTPLYTHNPHLHNQTVADSMLDIGELKIKSDDYDNFSIPCKRCNLPLNHGDVAVTAERAGKNAHWHPNCFKCNKCDELLADLVYFFYKDDIYCARDLAEALEVPRCAACDELIFSRSYTAAEGSFFHLAHFCCYHCDAPLAGKQYVPDEKTRQPICLTCYDKYHAEKCQACKKVIAPEQQGVSWSTFHWHGDCFNCAGVNCNKSLLSGRFVVKNEMPFCSAACIQNTN